LFPCQVKKSKLVAHARVLSAPPHSFEKEKKGVSS
jgi:hypothetical protein